MSGDSDDTYPVELTNSNPATPESPADRASVPALARELPIENYKNLTIPEIVERIPSLSPDELREIQDYERTHRRRKTLLVRLERHLRSVTE